MSATITSNQQEKIALQGQTSLTTNFSLHDLRIAFYGGKVSQNDAIRAYLQSQLSLTTIQSLGDLWRLFFIMKGVINQVSLTDMAKDFFTNIGFAAASNAPTVTDSAATGITASQATGNGNVSSDGGASITERGFVWGTSANPTTSSNVGKQTAAGTTGAFTATMGSLSASTVYHYRAYAINSQGTSYGADQTFTTNVVSLVNESMATSPSTGTLDTNAGDAAWNAGGYFLLTDGGNQRSDFYYAGNLGDTFTMSVDMKMSVTNGADSSWFYWGANTHPHQEDDSTNIGYVLERNDFSNFIALRFAGTILHQENYTKDTNFDTLKIVNNNGVFTVSYLGSTLFTYTDPSYPRSLPGTEYGWGARCGGTGNSHEIKNLLITQP